MDSTPARRSQKEASGLGREIWSLLYRLFQASRPALMAICQQYELTPSQAFLLRYLEPHKPIAMNILADTLGCDASNITGLVDKLEARGFIERQPGRTDRRVKMIVVTEAGARFRKKLLNRLLEPPASLSALADEDKRMLRNILKRAVEAGMADFTSELTAPVPSVSDRTPGRAWRPRSVRHPRH